MGDTTKQPVLLDWVQRLPLRQQSTLLSGLRGPDTHHAPKLKAVIRWLRPATQYNADPTTDYMRVEPLPAFEKVRKELEFCSMHYYAHLMHAMEIIGYKHPDEEISGFAFDFYEDMVDAFHCKIETEIQMDRRLRDNPSGAQTL